VKILFIVISEKAKKVRERERETTERFCKQMTIPLWFSSFQAAPWFRSVHNTMPRKLPTVPGF